MNVALTTGLRARQRGVVLVVSLLLLLVLTVIGLAATRTTALEERMAANQNDQEVAFQSAEAALRYAEGQLNAAVQPNFAGNTAGAFTQVSMGNVTWQNIDWSATSTATEPYGSSVITSTNQNLILTGNGSGQTTSYRAPRYFIVFGNQSGAGKGTNLAGDAPPPTSNVYYIFARGWGQSQNENVYVTLEAVDSFD